MGKDRYRVDKPFCHRNSDHHSPTRFRNIVPDLQNIIQGATS